MDGAVRECGQFQKMEKGGHFAVLEVPNVFAEELRSFFYGIK
jgi:hypothetical protein